MSTTPDALAVLKRADQRYAHRNGDDPNPAAYLQHLAAALTPLLQPGTAAVDLDHATELDQLRTELDATRLELEKTRLTEEGRRRDLTDERQHRDLLSWLHAEATWHLEQAHHDAEAWRERSDGWQGDANQYGSELLDVRAERNRILEHLGQLVDAINEQWLPDGDLTAQVDRAMQLVTVAHDQLQQRHDNGEHIHTYQRTPTGRHKPCPCGKPFPGKQPTRQPTKGVA